MILFTLLITSAAFLAEGPAQPTTVSTAPGAQEGAARAGGPLPQFPDFAYMPPPREYDGRIFVLSQTYPQDPKVAEKLPAFLQTDFRLDWKKYILQVRDYCFEGNVLGGDVEDDWRVGEQKEPRWFHMPWQHYGVTGREGVHGLTKEAPIKPGQLWQDQTYDTGQVYAVGFFNEIGGLTIGEVWSDHNRPNPTKAIFRVGTVVCKPLFTDVPVSQVPFLVNPLQWTAYITENYKSEKRSLRKVSLIQMDIMVRDDRSPTGWVFGTFQYNGLRGQSNRWYNLVPVGLQWGNDPSIRDTEPNTFPFKTRHNRKLKETVINENDNELPATHLGWNGRLNGPVDNPMSSCISCHMTAQAPEALPLGPTFQDKPPAPGSDEWMRWFQNLKAGERMPNSEGKKSTPVDFSLQLARSIQNFYDHRNSGANIRAWNYKGHQRGGQNHAEAEQATQESPFKMKTNAETGQTDYKVRRNGPILDR